METVGDPIVVARGYCGLRRPDRSIVLTCLSGTGRPIRVVGCRMSIRGRIQQALSFGTSLTVTLRTVLARPARKVGSAVGRRYVARKARRTGHVASTGTAA